MIVRNLNDKEVIETTYRAHGGAIAQMILDRRTLKEIGLSGHSESQTGQGDRGPCGPDGRNLFYTQRVR